MKIKLTENIFEEDMHDGLFLYMLRAGPEYGRITNRYLSALVRVRSYHIRTRSVYDALLPRTCVQPWLKQLLSPYYLCYAQN